MYNTKYNVYTVNVKVSLKGYVQNYHERYVLSLICEILLVHQPIMHKILASEMWLIHAVCWLSGTFDGEYEHEYGGSVSEWLIIYLLNLFLPDVTFKPV